MRAVRQIEHCDVAILMIDATRGFEGQDQNIFWLAEKNRKGIVVLVNKWDLIEKETNTMKKFEEKIRERIAPFTDVPIIFTSTITKQRLLKALETAIEVFENRKKRIATSKLNEAMLEVVQQTPPPATKGKYIKIKYCMQLPTPTPQFAFFANLPQYVRDPYKRFVENKLRELYDFSGVRSPYISVRNKKTLSSFELSVFFYQLPEAPPPPKPPPPKPPLKPPPPPPKPPLPKPPEDLLDPILLSSIQVKTSPAPERLPPRPPPFLNREKTMIMIITKIIKPIP